MTGLYPPGEKTLAEYRDMGRPGRRSGRPATPRRPSAGRIHSKPEKKCKMKIARVESFLFNPGTTRNLLFCRIETDSGLHGWGEAYVTAEKEKAVDEYLRAMAGHLIGRSAFSIRHTGQVLFDDFVIRRSSIGFLSAWSAIEIALWDIVGKAAGHLSTICSAARRVSVFASMPMAGPTNRAHWTRLSSALSR